MNGVAVVASAVDLDQLARAIDAASVALQDAERIEKRDDERLSSAQRIAEESRADAADRRLALGRLLCEARKAWPARGPNAKGWGEFLLKRGIGQDTALNYMKLAGYAEISRTDGDVRENIPTLRAAGIDKRPRKRDEQPDPPPAPERDNEVFDATPARSKDPVDEPNLFASWKRDISRALVGLDKMIMGYAKSWPRRSRSDLARTLRSVAERIESMTED